MNEPTYPLTREEFCRALTTGHGRARIHVERFGAAEFRGEILEAATVCKVFDGQSEGLRTQWLVELCVAAGVVDTVIAHQGTPQEDREQRVALLKEFCKRAYAGANAALYAECVPSENTGDVFACEEIVEIDGEKGFLFVARTLGALLVNGDDSYYWLDGSHIHHFDEVIGEVKGCAILERAALSDPMIRAYLDGIAAREARRDLELARTPQLKIDARSLTQNMSIVARNATPRIRTEPPRKSIQEVLDAIVQSEEELYWLTGWARRAEREELQQVLLLLPSLSRPRALENALRCLGSVRGLPPLDPRIFELTCHENSTVRAWAARTLSLHSLPGVRALGLGALARGDVCVGLEILKRSAQIDDAEAILAALAIVRGEDEQHRACTDALNILEHCPEVVDARIALHIYEHTPCMSCREKSIWLLERWHATPRWIEEECAYDGSESIRELAVALKVAL